MMQEKWIGYSEGAYMFFDIEGRDGQLEVYTTRQDTIFGATFCALAPNHPLAQELVETDSGLRAYIDECNRTGAGRWIVELAEKTGYDTGVQVRHPLLSIGSRSNEIF